MRFFFMTLALIFSLPLEAAPKLAKAPMPKAKGIAQAKKAKRSIATNNLPSRVITFVCREEEGAPESALGLTHMNVDLRDKSTGAFSTSLYLRSEKGFTPRNISGTYTTAPGGFILRAKWPGGQGDYVIVHIHPNEKTKFPGQPAEQACEVTALLESP